MLDSALIQAQPAAQRRRVVAALTSGRVSVAILMRFEFSTGTVLLAPGRNVPVIDGKDGDTWAEFPLPVTWEDIEGGPENWAPRRRYSLSVPLDLARRFDGAALRFPDLSDKTVYQDREAVLALQLLDPRAGPHGEDLALGYPIVLHTGLMDRRAVKVTRSGIRHDLYVEGLLARKRVTGSGLLTPRDQKARHPGDLGLDHVTEVPIRPSRWPNY